MTQTVNITPDMPIGELAARLPRLIPALWDKGLDFCCGGEQSLARAAAAKGLDPAALARELQTQARADATADDDLPVWEPDDVEAAIDYILARFHEGHRAAFPGLLEMMAKVRRRHGDNFPFLNRLSDLVQELAAELGPHMEKEETVLFPLIRRHAAKGGAADPARFGLDPRMPIQAMRIEHEGTGRLIDEIRRMTGDFTPPAGACATFVGLYQGLAALDREIRLHVHSENNALFPMVEALFEEVGH